MRVSRRSLALAASIAAAIILCTVYYRFDPEVSPMPRCFFKALTGWDCPGCGSQRALHALLHGDAASAWGHNAAIMLLVPLMAFYAVAEWRKSSLPRLYALLYNRWAIYALLAGITGWTLWRNLA